jgi:hypothetical protein
MVRGMARTTGSAASGVNAMGQSAERGIGVRPDHNGRLDGQPYTVEF